VAKVKHLAETHPFIAAVIRSAPLRGRSERLAAGAPPRPERAP